MNPLLNKLQLREVHGRLNGLKRDIFEQNRSATLFQRDIKGHTGCVNAVEFSPNEKYIVSGGDDCSVKMWSTTHCCVSSEAKPVCSMAEHHYSNIFTLQFSHHTERIYSAGNDYRLLIHDISTQKKIRCYKAEGAYYRITNHPSNDNVIAAASEDNNVYVYDFRETDNIPSMKLSQSGTAYAAEYSPVDAYLLAVCSNPDGLTIYDLRNPTTFVFYPKTYARAGVFSKHAICSSWHPGGRAIFCIRNRGCPLYFNLNTSNFVELKDPGYSNLCTVKSNSFAGENYVITGSDDWNIYVWKMLPDWENVPKQYTNQAYTVLKGHRSIVNHVRYSEQNNILISCGVEKIIKCWSPFELQGSYSNPTRRVQMPRLRRYRSFFESSPRDSVEEDWDTLQQFDAYYQQALYSRDAQSLSDSSASEYDEFELYEASNYILDELYDDISDSEETAELGTDNDDDSMENENDT